MNYTKEWKVTGIAPTLPDTLTIYADGKRIAIIFGGENQQAIADLIAAAVNACRKVNHDNPMAVAEALSGMYEACKEIMERFNGAVRFPLQSTCDKMNQAIAKAEGGK